ncbi:MAG: hypothetical protein JF887_06500 [Candidatus Dormibacteraeota bacterium]|uniref:Uncharacterized protein n=1 Tax=Candidatus Amunia macphersoniae TaxID=3127014 RepID=A0A934NGA1_9BACT|nr:hypothetical protein [Candidatus Dormibacteraeota bacterium]
MIGAGAGRCHLGAAGGSALPFGSLGDLVNRVMVRRDLERIFDYRREAIRRLLR